MGVSKLKDKAESFLSYEVLSEEKSNNIDKLFEIYAKDRIHASVYYNSTNNYDFKRIRTVLYRYKDGISIFKFEKTFGISKNHRIYNHNKCTRKIILRKNKFYVVEKNSIRVLNFEWLKSYVDRGIIDKYIIPEYSWLRFIDENHELHNISFNLVMKNKLYNRNDLLRYLYKAPLPTILEFISTRSNSHKTLIYWREIRYLLKNIENLRGEMLLNDYFGDTCTLAKTLGKKINCSWSCRRLKEMHDKWTRELSDITWLYLEESNLEIEDIFFEFEEFSGYKLFRTNKDLWYEGKEKHHCVGTYSNKKDCGIYSVNGKYTLAFKLSTESGISISREETKVDNKVDNRVKMKILDFRGSYNSRVPMDILEEVNAKMNMFLNLKHSDIEYIPYCYNNINFVDVNDFF